MEIYLRVRYLSIEQGVVISQQGFVCDKAFKVLKNEIFIFDHTFSLDFNALINATEP